MSATIFRKKGLFRNKKSCLWLGFIISLYVNEQLIYLKLRVLLCKKKKKNERENCTNPKQILSICVIESTAKWHYLELTVSHIHVRTTKRLLDYSALNYRPLQGLGEKATESHGASYTLPPTMSPLCFTLPLSATLFLCSTSLPLIIL